MNARIAALLFGLSLLPSKAGHAAETLTNENLPYAIARITLLQRGFHPYVMPGAATCEDGNPRCYPELMGCAHKRHWICEYTWRSGNMIFQAETNADIPNVISFFCLINCNRQAPTPHFRALTN